MILATFLTAFVLLAEPATFERVEGDEEFPVSGRPNLIRGHLQVSESPASQRRLALPVAVMEAPETQSARSPIVYIGGGPGIGSLAAARYPGAYPWTSQRDFIVYARRGTLGAEPSMDCPELGAAFANTNMERTLSAVAVCRDRLLAKNVDLNAYNTQMSARDLEALREALGYEKLSLFALSYGTRLALTYAREYPERVEAIVLDGPLPHTVSFDEAYPSSVEQVLRAVAEYCVSSHVCDAAHPSLERRFFEAIDGNLSADEDGRPSAAQLALAALPSNLDDVVPAIARMEAIAQGDFESLQDRINAPGGRTNFVWAVRLSVWCSERGESAEAPVSGSGFAGLIGAVFAPDICDAWGVAPRPSSELEPLIGDIPTLILAGALDTLTPPQFCEVALSDLERARLVSLPLGFHSGTTNWGGDGRAMSIAAAFFENPEQVLDRDNMLSCVAGPESLDFSALEDEGQRLP